MDFDTEPRIQGKPIYLGILGSNQHVSKQDIHEKIIHPIIGELGRLPDRMLLPSEGLSSAYISLWAERAGIDTQTIEADWRRLQRKAAILRDARILKESTHLIVFENARSKSNENTAIKEAKKGKKVFLINHDTYDVTELVLS